MTLFITHSACLEHLTPPGHPERPDRLRAIEQVIEQEKFMFLLREQCPKAELEVIARCHPVGIHRADSQGRAADRAGRTRR
jgi:acetoin utilization deacetylase AcuC-like enzyme